MSEANGSLSWLRMGAILGALGVAIGAFGAHALPGYLEETGLDAKTIAKREATFETGVRYHMYHAIELLFASHLVRNGRAAAVACCAFLAGILLFSGFLYANALTGIKWLGAIVPLGGVAFIFGWVSLACVAKRPE